MSGPYTSLQVAQVCHEANRALQAVNGDACASPPWAEEPASARRFAEASVDFALAGGTPEDQHRQWREAKGEDGWTCGPVKDSCARTHPSLVGYGELPEGERAKDAVFAAIVRAMAGGGPVAARVPEREAQASPSPDLPAVIVYAARFDLELDAAEAEFRFIPGQEQVKWRAVADEVIRAGGWAALAAEIEELTPGGKGVSGASTILAQVCRAVTARLTGTRPQGTVSVWIDDEGRGDAKVTVAWGAPREAEKVARGE